MNKFEIFLRKKKSRIMKNWRWLTLKYWPQLSIKKQPAHPLKPAVTKGKSKVTMVTVAGRVIESISYPSIFIITVLILVGSALFYNHQLWPGPENTFTKHNFVDCLYFSVVTFTSLGYGDMSPIGYSRLIAGLEVFSGLFLVAILVGKIASERQGAWIQLIYTSVNQTRLNRFRKSIMVLTEHLKASVIADEEQEIADDLERIFPFVAGIKNYLLFQSNQGKLAYFGNKSALKRLYTALLDLQKVSTVAYKNGKFVVGTNQKIERIQVKIYVIAAYMQRFHKNHQGVMPTLRKLLDGHNTFIKIYEQVEKQLNGSIPSTRRMTEGLLEKVRGLLPPKPWQKGVHIAISDELNISRTLSTTCISELIRRGIV